MANAFDCMFLTGGEVTSHEDYLLNNDFLVSNDVGTISPQELFRDDSMIMSAPPSTAFPNLSTPESGYLESPQMPSSGLNTSPLDELLDGTLNMAELDALPPLFPQDSCGQFGGYVSAESFPHNNSFSSINSRPSANASPMVRQKSSPGRPPTIGVHSRKHSLNSGINKAKPRKHLPEILIESEDDKETAKRKKNTAAARKSRQRKQENQEMLEAEINRLRELVVNLGGDPDLE